MVLGIQIFGVLFGLFMMYLTFLNVKRREYTPKEYFIWMLVWICLIIVALFPNILDVFVVRFQFSRTLDLLIISGFLFLIAVTFRTYTIMRKNQNKIDEIVRKLAIERKE